LELAGPGVKLGLAARRTELLDEVVREVEARGGAARLFELDVTDDVAVAESAKAYLAWAGTIDCVIANAGIGEGMGGRGSMKRVAEVFAVNTIGVTNTVLAFLPAMKAPVRNFMDALRMELHGSGVHAMTLCPGFVRTPLTDKNSFEMPFLMETDAACRTMLRAIARQDATYTFPWQMRLVSVALRWAPEWLVRRSARRTRKSHAG
jgi:short-subunit dehydrogenase